MQETINKHFETVYEGHTDPFSTKQTSFCFQKEHIIAFSLFEIKGLVDSMIDMTNIDERYDHPSLDRLQKRVNETITLLMK